MFDEQTSHDTTKIGLELLCDVEVLLGLTCIIPMLKLVQRSSKFAQNREVLICNFVDVVKKYEVQLYHMHYDYQTMYGQKEFGQFLEHSIDVLRHVWLLNQNIKLECVTFLFYGYIYTQYKKCIVIGALNQVSKVDCDTPPISLMDSNASPKLKVTEE